MAYFVGGISVLLLRAKSNRVPNEDEPCVLRLNGCCARQEKEAQEIQASCPKETQKCHLVRWAQRRARCNLGY